MQILAGETFLFELAVIAILICFYWKFDSRKLPVKIKFFEGGKMPEYKTKGAACADCYCRIPDGELEIPSYGIALVNLGFALEVPDGYKTVIDPRSSFLNKEHSLVCHGEIDNDYRGELRANVINLNPKETLKLVDGQRICQVQIVPVYTMSFEVVDDLGMTERGIGGFGSTGV